jgi:pre-mRNA-splicing factor ATP-dependent RNA helicase DHX38/PRP16
MEMVKVVKDISSDIAVLSKKGSTVLKDLREKNERSKMRERFWELAGTQLGNVLKVEKKEVDKDKAEFKADGELDYKKNS